MPFKLKLWQADLGRIAAGLEIQEATCQMAPTGPQPVMRRYSSKLSSTPATAGSNSQISR